MNSCQPKSKTYFFTGNTNKSCCELVTLLRKNKLLLNETNLTEDRLFNFQKAVTFYQFANVFNFSSLEKTALCYIERCFTTAVKTECFLELDCARISKVLASSGLKVGSEVDVYKAASAWLRHRVEERKKFARKVVLAARLHQLSRRTLRFLLSEPRTDECAEVLKKVLADERPYCNKTAVYFTSRRCNQSVLICGGWDVENHRYCQKVSKLNVGGDNFSTEVFPLLPLVEFPLTAVSLKDEVYVFGNYFVIGSMALTYCVVKYSPVTASWVRIADMYDTRVGWCSCSFGENIWVIGGERNSDQADATLRFDPEDYAWQLKARMNRDRFSASCAVFEGRIVVSGGHHPPEWQVPSVECYDAAADVWTSMSNLVEGRDNHSMVVTRGKLLVIGGTRTGTCEVYDGSSKKFVRLMSPDLRWGQAVSVRGEVFVFKHDMPYFYVYDVDEKKWVRKESRVTWKKEHYTCVKLPFY